MAMIYNHRDSLFQKGSGNCYRSQAMFRLIGSLTSCACKPATAHLCLQSTAAVQCKSLGVSREQCQQLLRAAAAAALQQHLLAANNS
jgi:hypothetical protein